MSAHNRRPPAGKQKRDGGARPTEAALIYGAHAVREALTAGKRKLVALYATANAIARIEDVAKAAGLKPQLVEARELTRRLGEEAVHQGLLLEAGPLPERDLSDVAATGGLILLLDQITDPHNVGAILRTAAAFAVEAIVVTERHSPQFSGVLAKAAAGAVDALPYARVVNLARALDELADLGWRAVGLAGDAPETLEAVLDGRPTVLVLGSEGEGLRRLVGEHCDALARIPMPGGFESLNVSAAAAVALYEATRRR